MDESPSLMDKWATPTRLMPSYYWAATRNALAGVPGVLTVIFLSIVLRRNPGLLKQYQYTVVLITFGGYILMLPVLLFNIVVAVILTYYGGRNVDDPSMRDSFLTSVWACSIAKQLTQAVMNCNFSIGFIISIMRYALLLHGIQMNWLRISIVSSIVMCPNLFYVIYILFFGIVVNNDCCELIMEVPEIATPICYYSYLMLLLIAAILLNIRTLFSLQMMKQHQGLVSYSRAQRDQFQLTLGLLVQSIAPLLSFGSFIVFMVLYLQGILGPPWFSTYTNIACYLSTLLNPIAAMCFIPLFRNELDLLLRCAKGNGINNANIRASTKSLPS